MKTLRQETMGPTARPYDQVGVWSMLVVAFSAAMVMVTACIDVAKHRRAAREARQELADYVDNAWRGDPPCDPKRFRAAPDRTEVFDCERVDEGGCFWRNLKVDSSMTDWTSPDHPNGIHRVYVEGEL